MGDISRYFREYRQTYSRPRDLNYEDLHHLASGIADATSTERDDPGLVPLLRELSGRYSDVGALARRSVEFIDDVVTIELSKATPRADHLRCLVEAACDPALTSTDIYTLNHDTLIEQVMVRAGIALTDGFESPKNGVRWWNQALLRSPSRTRLYKLHGSINWYLLEAGPRRWWDTRLGIPEDPDHVVGLDGIKRHQGVRRPTLLTGRFNKELRYTSQAFFVPLRLFHEALDTQETLVASGYSFGDKAMNNLIVDWIYGREGRRLVLLHEDPETLREGARGAIQNSWDNWIEAGALIVEPRFLAALTWAELRPLCGLGAQ